MADEHKDPSAKPDTGDTTSAGDDQQSESGGGGGGEGKELVVGGSGPRKRIGAENWVILALIVLVMALTAFSALQKSDPDERESFLLLGLGAACTLVVFSFLYKENLVYRFFEHILVGLGVGYMVGISVVNQFVPKFIEPIAGKDGRPANYWWLLLAIPGSLWYFQLSKKNVWLSRLIIAFFLGFGAGSVFKAMNNLLIGPDGNGQILDTFRSFTNFGGSTETVAIGANTLASINNFIFVGVTVLVLSYFFFSFRHEGNPVLRTSARTGRYLLMVTFGAIFGGAVMGRMALLIGRLDEVVNQWFFNLFA
jgi:hypothetical protein